MIKHTETNIKDNELNIKNFQDNRHILSYLTFLEKFYEQSKDKSHQERIFRINKAINSIKKYSNCKVSSFNVKLSKHLDTNSKISEQDNLPKESETNSNDIEDILLLIEKELKQNGINENDISNSSLSTSKKTINSSNNMGTDEKLPSPPKFNENPENLPNSKFNLNQKRLSKLFLKIELRLKTFLQENTINNALNNISKENSDNNNDNNKNENMSLETKMEKSPSKLPNVIDCFFSNKKKVDSILSKVRKQRRKSVMDFKVKYKNFSKEEKENEYIKNSDNDKNSNKKRKKIMPCSAKVEIRDKIYKNPTSEKISNFCAMIDEKEEERDDFEEIIRFDKFAENGKDNIININNNNFMKEAGININNDNPIKITSSLNNKNKFNFNNENNDNINNNNDTDKDNILEDKKKLNIEIEDDNNYHFVSKNSVFNNDDNNNNKNSNECNIIINENKYGSKLLDDDILMNSSDNNESSNDKNEGKESYDSNSESDSNSVEACENNKSIGDEAYNFLQYINNSKLRKKENEDDDEKYFSPFRESNSNSKGKKLKSSFQREIIRANNINGFTMNSILSPMKVDVDEKLKDQNCVIEEFTKFNS